MSHHLAIFMFLGAILKPIDLRQFFKIRLCGEVWEDREYPSCLPVEDLGGTFYVLVKSDIIVTVHD